MSADLIFESAPASTPDLLFGAVGDPPVLNFTASSDAAFPAFGTGPLAYQGVAIGLESAFPTFGGTVEAIYDTHTQRPTVGTTRALWQEADDSQSPTTQSFDEATPHFEQVAQVFQDAEPASEFHSGAWVDATKMRTAQAVVFQDGVHATSGLKGISQDGVKRRTALRVAAEDGVGYRLPRRNRFQDGLRDRRNWTAGAFQDGVPYFGSLKTFGGYAIPKNQGRRSRFQEGRRPPAGRSVVPVVPPVDNRCYTPDPDLLFAELPGFGNLVFICERHLPPGPGAVVVVPIREVYVILNEVSLRRVDTNTQLPTFNMSLSLDVDSYTWSLSASLPGQTLADLQPAFPGDPVLLEAMINGVAYRFLVNSISRERKFAQSGISISARGLLSTLDAPFVPTMYFGNDEARTAQQLMGDVLKLNGIPLDWAVEWGLTDWNVPANVWSHTGSYISALNVIAQAAGGYIQPHPSLQTLYVKPRYPDGPWNWDALTPDFEIPAAVATTEGIEWLDKAVYNRVHVSGEAGGVLGVITRAGTAGDLVAQMVTDSLITEGPAARQRGLSILSDTGLQANVTLRMPVLTETGIIVPGHLIDYVDGGTTRRGIVRSTQVSVGGEANVWMNIGVETHV